ncbi:MAG: hypothetical protein DCC71_07635 [Proteobacteria bacterium]|nr:MAG: hypothetical protein DCC71_07635 [Pseudomonadota bacterium]
MSLTISVEYQTDGAVLTATPAIALPLARTVASSTSQTEQAHILEDLWSNELLEQTAPGRYFVRWASLFDLDATASEALGLPRPEEVDVELTSSGIPGGAFSIDFSLRHRQEGTLPPEHRLGPAYLFPDGKRILVPQSVWDLICQVENRPGSTRAQDAFEYIARCKRAALAAGARLDGFLDQQDVVFASKLDVIPTETEDGVEIAVSVEGLEPDAIVSSAGTPRPVVTAPTADGRTKRIVVPPELRDSIRRVRSRRHLRNSEIPEFLTNPDQFLPPGVDLTDFSKRVRGFRTRVYNSRPYLHVTRSERGWLEFDAGVHLESANEDDRAAEDPRVPLTPDAYEALAREARRTGSRYVRHGDAWVEIDPATSDQFLETVQRVRAAKSQGAGAIAALQLDVIPNVELLEFDVSLPQDLVQRRPWEQELPTTRPPASLEATLDEVQLIGFRWLQYLSGKGMGGLLADEMGVGKTLQVIAHLLCLHEQGAATPSLIVLPKTLIANWFREIRRFAPSLSPVHVHDGPARTNAIDDLQKYPIVLTSYDVARSDQLLLGTVDWKVVVADEAQFVKNPTASRTSAVKALKAVQPLALTGTPVENGLLEFWCIMDFVRPGLLKSRSEFRDDYESRLARAKTEEQRKPIVADLLERLDPHYLRRKKDEVLRSLPPKRVIEESDILLSSQQRSLYLQCLEATRAGGRGAVLAGIGRLLRICAHGRLESADWVGLSSQQLVDECPKLERTLQRIEQIRAAGEKVLIFAEWKEMQRILQKVLYDRFGIWADIVNGDVTDRRQELLDSFRATTGFAAVILSVQVAGFGINLVEANHVIHYTRPWNPAKENQATDRVHRRGQKRPVEIYLPIVGGTVESRLAELLREKEQLARDVMRPSSERLVSAEDLLAGADLTT